MLLRFCVVLSLCCPLLQAWDLSGLQISVAGDIVGELGLQEGGSSRNRLDVRGAEILFYAPVDPYLEAAVSIAAHMDEQGPVVALHEAYLVSPKLIPRSRIKLGQYFLGIGRLNQIHPHDWPFISAPKVFRLLFDGRDSILAEGALDTGIEYQFLFPLPHFLELTLGVTNGWTFGHTHVLGRKPLTSTHYGRLATSIPTPWEGHSQFGVNYLGRKDAEGANTSLLGIDYTAKWRHQKTLTFLFQSEYWMKITSPKGADTQKVHGFYLYPQYGLSEDFSFGVRFDYYALLDLEDARGNSIGNSDIEVVPTVTYQPSEFSKFRLAYHFVNTYRQDEPTEREHKVQLQAVFLLGAHPAHDF